MRCLQPLKIRNPNYDELGDGFIEVACNKCYNCLVNRKREWFLRLSVEASDVRYGSVLFVTLTYDDEHLPWADLGLFRFNTLRKSDLQKFFKRLRKDLDFNYYAIGEYGTNTLRPHYHFIVYSTLDSDTTSQLIECKWNLGFVLCESINAARIGYVLHYHTRPKVPPLIDYKIKEFALDDDVFERAFSVSSNGLGISLLTDELLGYLSSNKTSCVRYQGVRYKLPRYYLKKFEIPLRQAELDSQFSYYRSLWSGDSFSEKDYVGLFSDIMKLGKRKMCAYNLQTKQL